MKNISQKEKRNIMLILEYDGSSYAGWQKLGKERSQPTLQNTLEEKLSLLLKEEVKLTASGRTDAGVHALGQVANFFTYSEESAKKLKSALNLSLPEDIRVKAVKVAEPGFHSRYSAISKTYEYRLDFTLRPCVFSRRYVCHYPGILDIKAMEEAGRLLTGTHDFRAFTTDKRKDKSMLRTIKSISISLHKGLLHESCEELRIAITGDGFLYNMVRIMVGTLVEIGEGKRKSIDIIRILKSQDRKEAGITMSPQGLFLKSVQY